MAGPEHYEKYQSKGGPSHMYWHPRSMIFSSLVLLIFLLIHLENFKFGETEMILLDGQQARDLKSLVIDTFQNPW